MTSFAAIDAAPVENFARLAELNGPVFGAVIEAGMLPAQSTLGILTVPAPAPRDAADGR